MPTGRAAAASGFPPELAEQSSCQAPSGGAPTRRDAVAPAITWFHIPVRDIARAKTFYETILGISLDRMESPPPMQMRGFPFDLKAGEISGALVAGAGAVPSATGTVVFLNGNPDLQVALDRVEGAGGRILILKTKIDMEGAGHLAMIADTEGNTVGLHSQG
jgi:hypothetical protein